MQDFAAIDFETANSERSSVCSVGECEIAAVVEKHGMRTVAIPFRSTAENLSRLFFDELRAKVSGLVSVCVWETADSRAEYRV